MDLNRFIWSRCRETPFTEEADRIAEFLNSRHSFHLGSAQHAIGCANTKHGRLYCEALLYAGLSLTPPCRSQVAAESDPARDHLADLVGIVTPVHAKAKAPEALLSPATSGEAVPANLLRLTVLDGYSGAIAPLIDRIGERSREFFLIRLGEANSELLSLPFDARFKMEGGAVWVFNGESKSRLWVWL